MLRPHRRLRRWLAFRDAVYLVLYALKLSLNFFEFCDAHFRFFSAYLPWDFMFLFKMKSFINSKIYFINFFYKLFINFLYLFFIVCLSVFLFSLLYMYITFFCRVSSCNKPRHTSYIGKKIYTDSYSLPGIVVGPVRKLQLSTTEVTT